MNRDLKKWSAPRAKISSIVCVREKERESVCVCVKQILAEIDR